MLTLYREIIPTLLAGSSVLKVRKEDFDFWDIFLGYLAGGALIRKPVTFYYWSYKN